MKALTIILMLIASSLCADAEIITHSHCVNHYRNNSENMHTHDVDFSNDAEAAEHRAKHTIGHPHTWEFDEFCPKGTERDTSKKSKPLPCVGCEGPKAPTVPIDTDFQEQAIVKIRHSAPTCGATQETLALFRTAFSVKSLEFPVLTLKHDVGAGLFEKYPLMKPFWMHIVVYGDAHPLTRDGKCAALVIFDETDIRRRNIFWQDSETEKAIDLTDTMGIIFSYPGNRNQHCHIDNIGAWTAIEVRVGKCVLWTLKPDDAPSAPSLRKPKLATMWAKLKAKQ